ncbi:MAG: beta-glucosidase [Candidatus Cryptobacteroides sp.]
MKGYKILLAAFAALSLTPAPCLAQKTPRLGKDPVKNIVKAMSLEEKAALVCGTWSAGYAGDGTVGGKTFAMVSGAAGITEAFEKYGIPHTVMADGPAGLRIDPLRDGESGSWWCTAFPVGTMLAATWDRDLIEEVGRAMGSEVLEYGCDVILGPGLNIHRNPMCGRNFEYYSEDPVLSGKCAAAMIRGIQSCGVGTSAKHFAANNQESCRIQNNAVVPQRALREIYLRSFEIAVKEGNPWTVMSSYNRVNGTYSMESRFLLTDVLRKDWGYRGLVVSDWFGKRDTPAQIHAGNDLLMPGELAQVDEIIAAVRSGKLAEEDLDICAGRVLEYVLKTPHFRNYAASDSPDLERNARVSRDAASQGMVLLKNGSGALPLSAGANVSLFGVNAYDGIVAGIGAGFVNTSYKVNLDEGLRNEGFILNPKTDAVYRRYMEYSGAMLGEENSRKHLGDRTFPAEAFLSDAFLAMRAADSDVAVVSLGRLSGEYNDRYTRDFYLHEDELDLLRRTCRAFHSCGKKVVVVLNICGVVETASWKDLPDAILVNWLPGHELGNATAAVLSGQVNPSGRLPMTFPLDYRDHLSSENYPFDYTSKRSDWEYDAPERQIRNLGWTEYLEGVDVGYRYFCTKAPGKISWPFGFGLSYTTFEWSDAVLTRKGNDFCVSLKVTNTGEREGRDVVELYASAPASAMYKPVRELKAFAKTPVLAPGSSATLDLTFSAYDLASFDESLSAFVTDAGTWQLQLNRDASTTVTTLPLTLKKTLRWPVTRPE